MVRGSLRHIRRATFVVVNPTHVAIALRYVAEETPVPMILVRAAGDGALRVKKVAAEAGIPTIEDPPLARQLYALDALGPIPPELYLAVAQIIAMLNRER
jgi:flagellar biosynthesis protein FlhB